MRLRSRILFIACLFTLLLASSVPQIITFQGRLMSNGSAVTGTKNMRFAIVDNSGNVKWQSHASNTVAVTVNNGIYTVKLGDTSITNMSALALGQLDQQITLNVRVWVEGEQLSPDIYLSAVPYALLAKEAETITSNVSAGNSIGKAMGSATQPIGMPKMTATQMNAISSPTEGSMVYNTTEDEIYWYSGSNWVSIKGTSANATYDTGWIACSDWTNQRLGSTLGGNVTHNLNANLSGLIFKVLISTDGTDTNSFDPYLAGGDAANRGISVYEVNSNSFMVQTGSYDILYVNKNGELISLSTQSYYYKIVVYKPNQIVSGVDASDLVNKAGDTMTGKLTAQAGIDVSGNIIPVSDNAYDLGSSTKRWREIYVSGNSIHIGQPGNEIKLSYANGKLAFDKPIEIATTTNGFTVPRMTAVQMNAISTPLNGSIVFNTTKQELYWYDGSSWLQMGSTSANASYDTGWIACSDWTDQHLGSTLGENVVHNLNANLSGLIVKVLISTDGTDINSFEVGLAGPGYGEDRGVTIYQRDINSIRVQTGGYGILYLPEPNPVNTIIDTEAWYYKIVVYKPKTVIKGANGDDYVAKSGSTMTGALTVAGTINATAGKLAEGGNALVPAGCVQMFAGSNVPGGWLLCNGAAISRTTYASLYAAIGTTYGTGDGSTTFNLPDFRGIFPRGAGTSGKLTNANGVSFNATIGAYQNDRMQGHKHSKTGYYGTVDSGSLWYANSEPWGAGQSYTSITGIPSTDGSNGTPRTGAETNPANLAVNFIIKY
jgi:microcystin-dependent protein